ncbi:uncharacterized protein [Dysidea avara]|uniref:uncharacterized protein isoform X2 n=1 Tax=Dysidea avara TaxID=196820 RepID=UPI00332A9F9E
MSNVESFAPFLLKFISKISSIIVFISVFIALLPALTDSASKECGGVPVCLSGENGGIQEITCCMQDSSRCQWISVRNPHASVRQRSAQTGLVLTWEHGTDSFGQYNCLNETDDVQKEVVFLPETCTTSTDVSLNITMWFNDSLISTPCELYRNGDVVPNIEPTSCIALNRVEHDFNMDTFTIVCPTCNDTYNIHYNIPRIMLTNVSDCSISGNCFTPSPTRVTSPSELPSTMSISENHSVTVTTTETSSILSTMMTPSPTSVAATNKTSSDDNNGGTIAGATVGGLAVVVVVIILIFAVSCWCYRRSHRKISQKGKISTTNTTTPTGPGDGARNEIEMTDTPINEDEQIGNPPPTFTIHPENKVVYLSEPETVSFTCQADNTTSYQWKKEDGSVPSDARGINSSTLSFENLQPAYDGKYHCVATNDSGSSVSYSATFTICDNTGELLVNNNSENKDLLPIILSLHKDMERYIDMKELYGTLNTYGLLVRNEREHLNPAGPSVKSPTEKINYFLLCLENKTQRELEGFLKALYSTAHVGGHNNLIKLLQGKGITIERNSTV